jgi:hypothetical protein
MMILTMLLVGAGLVVQTADRVPNLDVKSIAANQNGRPHREDRRELPGGRDRGAQGSRKGSPVGASGVNALLPLGDQRRDVFHLQAWTYLI